ncbi:MAG: YHYH domain-containing protein [Desulfuromonadales bacterium]|nr:YHYH domain-containing protein [Desulfuromonadales bacterium]
MKTFLYILVFIVQAGFAAAHPGGLDASGGHYKRATGEYHLHQDKDPSIKTASLVQDSPALSAAARELKINDYFRSANEKVGAFDCDLVIHERDVSTSLKAVVKARDGYRCVICGSTHQLEVDHRRALMNGGDNAEGNLATLCDDCHTAKTRMDNSLRRKRERVCR